MHNLAINLSFFNIFNLVFGVFIGFFLMLVISISIISIKVKKNNKNEQIRQISKRTYYDYYLKNEKIKDRIISSLIYQTNEISKLKFPDKKHPLYELSINDILNGINHIQKKLKKITNHPLFKDFKDVHITTLVNIEEYIAKPVIKISKNKYTKFAYNFYRIIKGFINIFNPLFYIKKILNLFLIKKGKKDIIIVALDLIGNTCYEVYNNENNLQK